MTQRQTINGTDWYEHHPDEGWELPLPVTKPPHPALNFIRDIAWWVVAIFCTGVIGATLGYVLGGLYFH